MCLLRRTAKFFFQSLFRPHRYVKVPPTTITRLDFRVADCRGKTVNLNNAKMSFVLTFHNPLDPE